MNLNKLEIIIYCFNSCENFTDHGFIPFVKSLQSLSKLKKLTLDFSL